MGAGSGSGSFVTAWRYGPPSSVLAWLAALQASRNSSLTRASKWLGSSPILDVNLGPHTSWSETPDVPVSHHQYAETPRTSTRPKESQGDSIEFPEPPYLLVSRSSRRSFLGTGPI